ncbi:hypothetical protein IFM89_014632 [Coptis chinensis]|uniref:CCHC-type domain-containing protein n=1 Tax=Coptis chinensis TaxID=261450 RepID=A0A835HSR6_9MAGN|nr:hypothetical protein IFM89_014632 [Coptis chinensis]
MGFKRSKSKRKIVDVSCDHVSSSASIESELSVNASKHDGSIGHDIDCVDVFDKMLQKNKELSSLVDSLNDRLYKAHQTMFSQYEEFENVKGSLLKQIDKLEKVKTMDSTSDMIVEDNHFSEKIKTLDLEKYSLKSSLEETIDAAECVRDEMSSLVEKNRILEEEHQVCVDRNKSLESKIETLKKDLDLANKRFLTFTNGTEKLDKLLCVGKSSSDKMGLSYNKNNSCLTPSSLGLKFVKSIVTTPQSVEPPRARVDYTRNFSYMTQCYNCGKGGHIRAQCKQKKKDFTCSLCGKKGHVSSFCWHYDHASTYVPTLNTRVEATVSDCVPAKRISHVAHVNKHACYNHTKLFTGFNCGRTGHLASYCWDMCRENRYSHNDEFWKPFTANSSRRVYGKYHKERTARKSTQEKLHTSSTSVPLLPTPKITQLWV